MIFFTSEDVISKTCLAILVKQKNFSDIECRKLSSVHLASVSMGLMRGSHKEDSGSRALKTLYSSEG